MNSNYDSDNSDKMSPEEIQLEEESYYNKLKVVYQFKLELNEYVEFYGILNINTIDLYNMMVTSQFRKTKKNYKMSNSVYRTFDVFYERIFGEQGTIEKYHYVIHEINKFIYV